MQRFTNGGLAWDGTRSRKLAILLIALCVAVLLVATLAPTTQATDTAAAAGADGEVVAYGFSYPGNSGGYHWSPYGSSSSMRGVSWS